MKLNNQAARDHAGLELSFHRHAARARCLRLRQRLDSSTRFPSVCTQSTQTTTYTAHTHERAQSLNFRSTTWRQPRTRQCSLPSLSCRLKRRPLRSLNFASMLRVGATGPLGVNWVGQVNLNQTRPQKGRRQGAPYAEIVFAATANSNQHYYA